MNCGNIWGPSDHSGKLQRPKPERKTKVGLRYAIEERLTIVSCDFMTDYDPS